MLEIKLKNDTEIEDYFFGDDSNKGVIYDSLYQCIERGILNNLDDVIFCNISFDDGESMDMVCSKGDYSKNLDNVLDWYEKTDQYERCIHLQTLKKRIDDK
jgi:hypothetical protein